MKAQAEVVNEPSMHPSQVALLTHSQTLYGGLLGAQAATLHPKIAKLHISTTATHATGTFTVTGSPRLLGRFIAIAGRLPKAGKSRAVALHVERTPGSECWTRTIGGRAFPSKQHRVGDELRERVGPLEVAMTVSAEAGSLRFRSTGSRFVVGRFACKLPANYSLAIDGLCRPTALEQTLWSPCPSQQN